MNFSDNEIDGETMLQLSEQMIARILPIIRLQVKFLNVLADLKKDQESVEPSATSSSLIVSSDRYNSYNCICFVAEWLESLGSFGFIIWYI
jgi:hypothetical protein